MRKSFHEWLYSARFLLGICIVPLYSTLKKLTKIVHVNGGEILPNVGLSRRGGALPFLPGRRSPRGLESLLLNVP
jgi:hypothetical protein